MVQPPSGTPNLSIRRRRIPPSYSGRIVATLVSKMVPAGRHTARWTAEGLPNGVYFYTLRAGDRIAVQALTLLR